MRYLQIKIKKGALTLSNGKRAQTVGFLLPCSSVVIHSFRQLQRMYSILKYIRIISYEQKNVKWKNALFAEKKKKGETIQKRLDFKKFYRRFT